MKGIHYDPRIEYDPRLYKMWQKFYKKQEQGFIDSAPKARHVETLEEAKERLRQAKLKYV